MKRYIRLHKAALTALVAIGVTLVSGGFNKFPFAQTKKPNVLVIWGDDIGIFNISAYNMGMMGYKTPNIDRVAKEGAIFTDWYGQQSCTAGRAAFITGHRRSARASPRSACLAPRRASPKPTRHSPSR